jgi:hypothetical protein
MGRGNEDAVKFAAVNVHGGKNDEEESEEAQGWRQAVEYSWN